MAIQKRPNGTYGVSAYDRTLGRKRWIGTARTEREARRMEAQAIAASHDRGNTPPTLAQWCSRWVDECPRPKESTDLANRDRARAVARAPFASKPLDLIRPSDAAAWARANPSAHTAARAMFADAARLGLVNAPNPFAGLRVAHGTGRKHIDPPTQDEVASLARHGLQAGGRPLQALILAAAWTGMRPGELFALQPGDVDLGAREIRVQRQYVTRTGKETPVKNGRPRTVVILEPAAEAIAWAASQGRPLMFTTPRGQRFNQGSLHYWWRTVRAAAGQPALDFYMLRHFHAAHLLNAMRLPAQDVAAQLGHTDGGRLVMERYGHPSELLARDRIKQAQTAMGSTAPPPRPVTAASGQHRREDAKERHAS